ncbi:MAG: cytochrome c oxidase subunit II [Elusimicrobia bacterium]|nr:cytochrome c oxidase subunit II [Elusimicrobiota bacterium]
MTESNYGWGLPTAASTFAKEIDFGIYLIHAAMFAIFILWGIFFVYLLIRYRARPGVAAKHEEHGILASLIPDFIVLAFELCLIFLYAIPSWSRIKVETPGAQDSLTVEVTAEQFAWDIHYPGPDGKFGRRDPALVHASNVLGLDPNDPSALDDIVTVNEMHIPLGRPTLMGLTSKDVIHSFFVPDFRIKQDAVPGMRIPVWFEPTKTGKFEIGCAQLCGFGHALMRGDVFVHAPKEFENWLVDQKPALNPTGK